MFLDEDQQRFALRVSQPSETRRLQHCEELVLASTTGQTILPARYRASFQREDVLEVLIAEVPQDSLEAWVQEGSLRVEACGLVVHVVDVGRRRLHELLGSRGPRGGDDSPGDSASEPRGMPSAPEDGHEDEQDDLGGGEPPPDAEASGESGADPTLQF